MSKSAVVTKKRKLSSVVVNDAVSEPSDERWSCPVCFDQLGDDGIVPCGLVSCRPVQHLVCYTCAQAMPKNEAGLLTCPICRRLTEAVPIVDFVQRSGCGAKTAALLAELAYDGEAKASVVSSAVDNSRKAAAKLEDTQAQLVAKRVSYVVDRVNKFLARGGMDKYPDGYCEQWGYVVPAFDQQNVRLKCKQRGFRTVSRPALQRELNDVARDMQPHISAIYEDSPYIINMGREQSYRSKTGLSRKPVYMLVTIKRRKAQQ
jgi:hypothetical protein